MFPTNRNVSVAEFARAFVLAAFGIFKTIPKKSKCTELTMPADSRQVRNLKGTLILADGSIFRGQCQWNCVKRNLAVEVIKQRGESVIEQKLVTNKRPVSDGGLCQRFCVISKPLKNAIFC